jgi:glutathione reductase (NADPH)|tara:strand:- start:133 stop:1488 length:1356 start_codon:yes stop_codon:yes gene_type:complete
VSDFDYDLVVIGAGSGGVRAARMSAGMGAKVAIVEDRYWGGTCVNVGCVPKKLYYYASHFSEYQKDATSFGWEASAPKFDWDVLKENRRNEILRLNGIYRHILGDVNVEQIGARATVVDANTVGLSTGKQITAERILIATGGWPFIPDFPGRELVVSSNEIFDISPLPKRMIIVGAGYIAVEFAGIFNGLGVETHLVYRGPKLLRTFDAEVGEHVSKELALHGINIHLNTNVTQVEKAGDELTVHFDNGDTLAVGHVLYATGRKPNVEGLGLEELGVTKTAKGFVEVDEFYQTKCPSIYAVGDIIEGPELTPVALAEGMVLANHLYGKGAVPLDYDYIATAVFCQPNIGTCGLTEAQARDQYGDVKIFKSTFRHLKHTLGDNQTKTFMKMIVDKASDKVVGIHMVGDEAGEIIQGLAVAMKAGVTKAQMDSTIGVHPTAAEEFVTMRTEAS